MTAIHLLKTPSAAFLVSDTAYIDDEGVVSHFGPKHTYIEAARLAFGMSGRGCLADFAEEMDKLWPGEGTTDDFLNLVPTIARVLREKYRAVNPKGELLRCDGIGANDFAIFVAMVDDDGPRLLALSSCPRPDIGPGDAYEWIGTNGFIQPEVDQASILPAGYWRGVRDCRILLEAQRSVPFPLRGDGIGVGGECFVTTITRDRVTHKRLCGWPDKVGEAIAP